MLGSWLHSVRYRIPSRYRKRTSWPLLVLLLVCFVGCGSDDGLNRKAIKGKVTVSGKEIPNGSITFEPLYSGGVGSGAVISKGTYAIEQEQGLPPGKYRVQITGDDGENFSVSEGMMPGDEIMPPRKQLVPPGWKQEIEVSDAGPFDFDFEIKGKK